MSKTHIIIVAAGSGNRFGGHIPKQFLPLGPERFPVLMHTIKAFLNARIPLDNITLVLNPAMTDFWNSLCLKHNFPSPTLVEGGETRFQSVLNALTTIQFADNDNVLIHDGARPLVTTHLINAVITKLKNFRSVVPVRPVTDSLRKRINEEYSLSVNRSDFLSVQTPQGFDANLLKTLYKRGYNESFTDDASVLDYYGIPVAEVSGDPDNIKITTPVDLTIAQALLAARQ